MNNENVNDNDKVLKKIKLFLENKIPVHLCLKDRHFMNGTIKQLLGEGFLFQDERFGEFYILTEDVFDLNVRRAK